MNKKIIFAIVAGITISLGVIAATNNPQIPDPLPLAKPTFEVSSFDDCVFAGFPVMESHPRQCRDGDGNLYVEKIEPIQTDFMITEIIDGDTVKINGESVRFALASAPELDEDGGMEAKNFIADLCPPGTFVTIDEDSGQQDGSFGRIIAVVHCNGVNLNEELVESGHGVLYTGFCGISEFASESWAQKHGCAPEFHAPPKASPVQSECDPSYPTICLEPNLPDLDCGDISHRNFVVKGNDPHGFDRDGDGIGCES